MHAELKPLEGKYYGSLVEIFDDANDSIGVIVVWLNPQQDADYKPSERELEAWQDMLRRDCSSLQEYENLTDEEKEYEICDNHYESVVGLKVCNTLVVALNKKE